MTTLPKIAVIGAGLSGLRLATQLAPYARIEIFEKSRGLGGRMATRRAAPRQFDHGAQYFTAHGAAFAQFLAPYITNGLVSEWKPRLVRLGAQDGATPPEWTAPRYVAQPAMNSLCKEMAKPVSVSTGREIAQITRQNGSWMLQTRDGAGSGPFDWVLSTAPALQTQRLMPEDFSGHAALQSIKMDGCFSLMTGFDDVTDPGWDAAISDEDPVAWIAANHVKPGRSGPAAFVCQSGNNWAEAHMEDDPVTVQRWLCDAFTNATGIDTSTADYISLHRWRYARVATPANSDCLVDAALGLGACGDWCGGGRVEAAFDSASALAQCVTEQIS